MGLSCFRCQPLSYHSIFVNYQPLSYDFGCQPLLCTCVLCTVYCCTVLCTGIVYILGQSCFAVNLFYDFGCQPLLTQISPSWTASFAVRNEYFIWIMKKKMKERFDMGLTPLPAYKKLDTFIFLKLCLNMLKGNSLEIFY